jgi:hypothetical protein
MEGCYFCKSNENETVLYSPMVKPYFFIEAKYLNNLKITRQEIIGDLKKICKECAVNFLVNIANKNIICDVCKYYRNSRASCFYYCMNDQNMLGDAWRHEDDDSEGCKLSDEIKLNKDDAICCECFDKLGQQGKIIFPKH